MTELPKELSENIEYRILQAMKSVLVDVIKDTTTKPGMVHPLKDDTIVNIRECLRLISARERELQEAAGAPSDQRPYFIDEPAKSVAVPITKIKRRDKESSNDD